MFAYQRARRARSSLYREANSTQSQSSSASSPASSPTNEVPHQSGILVPIVKLPLTFTITPVSTEKLERQYAPYPLRLQALIRHAQVQDQQQARSQPQSQAQAQPEAQVQAQQAQPQLKPQPKNQ